MRIGAGLIAAIAAIQAGLASAGTAAGDCELHVWASAGMGETLQTASDNLDTSYMGALLARSPQRNIATDRADVHTSAAQSGGPLPTGKQIVILSALDLPTLLGVPEYRPVFHDNPLDGLTLRNKPGRYVDTPATCYADLVLSDVVYSREYANGQNLKSFFRFRDFGDTASPQRKLSTWAQTRLVNARAGKKANPEASDAELPAALAENARKFAGYFAKVK